MPELPEVETIARGLRPHLVGARIREVRVPGPHATPQGVELFRSRLEGGEITAVGRRGKVMTLGVGENLTLAVHLRMTGRFYLPSNGELVGDKHTHCVFFLENRDGATRLLLYNDVRKFGTLQAFTPEELLAWPFFASLGPEPLEISRGAFMKLFQGRRTRIKAMLLDQKVIAGIGNIYADESLFRAGIRPDAPAGGLSGRRLGILHGKLREVLQEAVDACGSSIRDYRDAMGDAGAFQNCFRVYGRGGETCVECGSPLRQVKVAGRTTVFCPKCQKT